MKTKNKITPKRTPTIIAVALISILFGVITIKEGGSVLFTVAGKSDAGNFVPFVLWFNFLAGFVYVLTGVMLFRLKSCARKLSKALAIATGIVFILFIAHILNGGAYEFRTLVAMTFRLSIWISIAIYTHRIEAFRATHCEC